MRRGPSEKKNLILAVKVLSIVCYPDTVGLNSRRISRSPGLVTEGPKTKGTGQVLFHSIEGNEGAYG